MSQQNMRKEPTFGEPTKVEGENLESKETTASDSKKFNFSLHSSKSPGHTFTPVMKRPATTAQNLASMEELAEPKANNIDVSSEMPMQNKATAFAFAPVVEESEISTKTQGEEKVVLESTDPITQENKPENVVPPMNNTIERVIPTQQTEPKKSVTEKVPSKYRRLILVALLALALLLVFFLLKPRTPETVEQLQEQGNSLPIEFRPVDEAEAKRAEEEAKALATQQAQSTEQMAQPVSEQSQTIASSVTPQTSVQTTSTLETPAISPTPSNTTEVTAVPAIPKVEAVKPVIAESTKKPSTNGSVIYQPETVKPQIEKKVEKIKPTAQPKPDVKVEKVEKVQVEKVPTPTKPKVEVVTAKPTVAPMVSTPNIVSTKTLVVPKGVSLMQVFRDNNLNISDVNAMSKVNSAVSNLKVGERVTVRLDKDNRVVEMRISAGTYIRQANGSYIFR